MFKSGQFLADHMGDLGDEQIQPNGVDLTVEAIFRQRQSGRIGTSGKSIGAREEIEAEDGAYELSPGGYVIQYCERVSIPEGHVGFLYPRSSLLRNFCTIDTAVWDAGYEGRGEGLLEVHEPITIEQTARVAQLVIATAAHDAVYEGSYQGERMDD